MRAGGISRADLDSQNRLLDQQMSMQSEMNDMQGDLLPMSYDANLLEQGQTEAQIAASQAAEGYQDVGTKRERMIADERADEQEFDGKKTYFERAQDALEDHFSKIRDYHLQAINPLFDDLKKNQDLWAWTKSIFLSEHERDKQKAAIEAIFHNTLRGLKAFAAFMASCIQFAAKIQGLASNMHGVLEESSTLTIPTERTDKSEHYAQLIKGNHDDIASKQRVVAGMEADKTMETRLAKAQKELAEAEGTLAASSQRAEELKEDAAAAKEYRDAAQAAQVAAAHAKSAHDILMQEHQQKIADKRTQHAALQTEAEQLNGEIRFKEQEESKAERARYMASGGRTA